MPKSFPIFLICFASFCLGLKPPSDAIIKLEESNCYGKCPSFVISISKNRQAIYTGRKNVEKIGTFTRKLDGQEYKDLLNAFEASRFFEFKDQYTSKITDLPTTYITFNFKNHSKTITDYYGAPQSLKKLENLVERVANAGDWVKK
jgi:hypothetical protein